VRTLIAAVCGALALSAGIGCGPTASGVDACKQVEEARCQRAAVCGISTEPPYSTNETPADACIRFYDVACMHGSSVPVPPAAQVTACVIAIGKSACDGGAPLFETDPACDWLTQNQPVEAGASTPEAGNTEDAGAGDARAE
jgi:hypothetical protein